MLDESEPGPLKEKHVRRIVREQPERSERRDPARGHAAIIASTGMLDWAYPPLILATTAAASGKILATDRGSIADMPAGAEDTGNELLEWHEDGDHLVYFVRKG
jgi:hypothetical protein